jgi:hypothetical protein
MTPFDLFLAVFLGLIAKDIMYALFYAFAHGIKGVWEWFQNKT